MLALFDYFPQPLRMILYRLPEAVQDQLEEIRLRNNQGLGLRLREGLFYADKQGKLLSSPHQSFIIEKNHLDSCLEQFTASSLYAREHELSCGYLTLEGGHRVGFCGTCIIKNGTISGIRDITSMNIRIAHQILGASDELMPYLLKGDRVKNTLIISPPGCGKTTLLRDIARNLSNGFEQFSGTDVAIADERGELAAVCHGVLGNDVGIRTDILNYSPKAEGMLMLLRTMSPKVLITDEIGSLQDENAIKQASLSGVSVICSAHGYSRTDIAKRMSSISKLFELFVTLEFQNGIHNIRSIEDYV